MPESCPARYVSVENSAAMVSNHASVRSAPLGGTVLAFDFGLKRIGVAVGEALLGRATALTTLHVESKQERFAAISRLIAEWQPALLVVGLPLTADGREHEMTARCRRFARQLHGRFGLPVALADERLTSAAAAGLDWKMRKSRIDAVAARHILQDYFDAAR